MLLPECLISLLNFSHSTLKILSCVFGRIKYSQNGELIQFQPQTLGLNPAISTEQLLAQPKEVCCFDYMHNHRDKLAKETKMEKKERKNEESTLTETGYKAIISQQSLFFVAQLSIRDKIKPEEILHNLLQKLRQPFNSKSLFYENTRQSCWRLLGI